MTMYGLLWLFLSVLGWASAQLNCAEAPTPALKIVCEQLHRWDKNARAAPPVTATLTLPPAIPGQPTPLISAELAQVATSPYQCMDLGCLCQYLGGNGQAGSNACTLSNGRPLTKALRKEYRMMTDNERDRYHAAVRAIKNSGEYDRIASIHSQYAESGGAHSGPAFLCWHREFIKRYEIALRMQDPDLALPYWDSTFDSVLARPAESILFSAELMGTTDAAGYVNSGFLSGWRTLNGNPNIRRAVGAQGSLFTENEIAFVMRQTAVENVLAYTAPQQGCNARTDWNVLEYSHGNIHIFVGGDMLDQSTSGNDPIFFMHHSFVDFIWELWRNQRQNRFDRENAYPLDQQQCSSPNHFGSALMRPFEPWRNHDGLSNKYTDNMFSYAPRPTCATGDCGSKYLFCDRSHGAPRCASKLRVGGQCGSYVSGETPCYNGICQAGRCVAGAAAPPVTQRPPVILTTLPPAVRPAPQQATCYNEHECCAIWAVKGECRRNPGYMNAWCKASCSRCTPNYDIRVECSDRHPNCARWSRSGECNRNPYWMAENCRRSCNNCGVTRTLKCGGGTATQSAQPAQPQQLQEKCTSPGCYNENICCQYWGLLGQCATNATWMNCNCRVSCGACIPRDYSYGSCENYHKDCRSWAARGECQKNPWMLENCKASCQTCLNSVELRNMCAGGASRRRGRDLVSALFQHSDGLGMPAPDIM
uniref:ShTK domain protein n=1 Tax=Panagrellus redivivus TaxID=6233 RepID=A0A7E4ZX04_PANRE